MKITLFLGAGASASFGFPITKEFKDKLENELDPKSDEILYTILQKSKDEDIEQVLTNIESLLKQTDDCGYRLLEKMVMCTFENKEDKKRLKLKSFKDIIDDFIECKKKIQSDVYKKYSWKDVNDEKLKENYDKIFDVLAKSDDGIHICTTNYDQIVEKYVTRGDNELELVDGFSHTKKESKSFFDATAFNTNKQNSNKEDQYCYLYKIHGSLNWKEDGDKIRRMEDNESEDGTNFVIYPTMLEKEYDRKPYSALWEQFKIRIKNSDVFIVIGCSFRDDEIKKQFRTFLNSKENTKLFVISPTADKDIDEVFGSDESSLSRHNAKGNNTELLELLYGYVNNKNTPEQLEKMIISKLSGDNNARIYTWDFYMDAANNNNLFSFIPKIYKSSNNRINQ